MATIKSMALTRMRAVVRIKLVKCETLDSSGSEMSANISSRKPQMTQAAMPPSKMTFSKDLTNSTSPFTEKMRLMPAMGLNLLKLGDRAFQDKFQPDMRSGPAKAAMTETPNSGNSASMICVDSCDKRVNIRLGSKAAARSKAKLLRIMAMSFSEKKLPSAIITSTAAINSIKVDNSRD